MKVVAVFGSPHKNGPSATIADGVRVHQGIKLVGVFAQGAKDRYEAAEKAYDWFLRDFQNRDMVLHAKIVHTSADSWEPDSAIMQNVYEAGRSL